MSLTSIGERTAVASNREPDFDAIVRDLRQLYVGAGIQLAIDMGQLIIERLFGGDAERWHSRGRKDVSFRKLERHPELPFHASTLSRAVAIYMLSKRRGDLLALQNVRPSHLYEIAGLNERDQDKLLAKVEAENWSMRKLRQEVEEIVGTRNRRKANDPEFARWLRRVRSNVESRSLIVQLDAVDRFELHEARELLETAKSLLQQMELVANSLETRTRELDRNQRVSDVAPRSVAAPEHSKRHRPLARG